MSGGSSKLQWKWEETKFRFLFYSNSSNNCHLIISLHYLLYLSNTFCNLFYKTFCIL